MNTAILERSLIGNRQPDNDEMFKRLVEQYANDMYRYAYWLCKSKEVAEDLTQDALLRAWKSIAKLQDQKAVKGWLFTIIRRENARRFERIQPRFCDFPTEDICEKNKSYDTSTEAFVLRQAIAELAEEYREPLLLQVLHGYSQKEIAAHLGISSAGVGTRLFRARQKLRDLMEQEPS